MLIFEGASIALASCWVGLSGAVGLLSIALGLSDTTLSKRTVCLFSSMIVNTLNIIHLSMIDKIKTHVCAIFAGELGKVMMTGE